MTDLTQQLQRALAARYEIDGELGHGGMATVYRARDVRHGRLVAIKAFAADIASETSSQRFLQEIRIVASLSHPHIVPLLDSGTGEGVAWFAMPVAEGESLRARLAREGQLPWEDARRLTLEVADALAYAHQHGVVHRDIKPENILLQHGHVLVTDFGVARAVAAPGELRLTATGVGVGTPAYMSPEQLSGDSDVGPRSDQYALSMVLYEMLVGEQPFSASTPHASLARKVHGDLYPVSTVRPSVTPAVDQLLRRALAPTPADRFPSVQSFADALRASEAPGAERPPRRIATRRVVVAALLGLAALAAGTSAWLRRATTGLEPHLVAIFPFRVTTSGAEEWGEGLPDLLATALDGTPGLRIADPWSLWRRLRETGGAMARSPDPQEAATLAGSRHAARFVLGTVRRDGPRLGVTVRVYRTNADSVEFTFTDAAPEDSLTALAQRLAVAVMSAMGESRGGTSGPALERYATRSPDAMKQYLVARSALRRGMLDSADRAIDRALAIDSTFALALSAAVEVKSWVQFSRGQAYAGLRQLVARGLRFADSLSERNRLQLQLQEALIETEGPRAAELARRLVELDSSSFEAWNALSYVRQAHGWQYGASASDARAAADRALALDSTNMLALVNRMSLAAFTADLVDIRRQLARLPPIDQLTPMVNGTALGLRLIAAPDTAIDSLLSVTRSSGPASWVAAIRIVRATRPDRALALAQRLAAQPEAGAPARLSQNLVAGMELAVGRQERLAARLETRPYAADAAARHAFDQALLGNALAGVSADAITARALDNLTKYVPIDSATALFATRDVWQTGWLVAAYQASYGDTLIGRRWRRVMDAFPTEGAHPVEYVKALQADLDARLAARRGDTRTALSHASNALRLWTIHTENAPPYSPEVQIRFLTARLLRAEHLADSAETLFRSLTPPVTWLAAITPQSWVELGEIAEERRDCSQASAHFEAALSLWDSTSRSAATARARALAGRQKCARPG